MALAANDKGDFFPMWGTVHLMSRFIGIERNSSLRMVCVFCVSVPLLTWLYTYPIRSQCERTGDLGRITHRDVPRV